MENVRVQRGMESGSEESGGHWAPTGANIISAMLWLMAAVIIGSITFRKIRLYVDYYNHRRHVERCRQKCNSKETSEHTERYRQAYNEAYTQEYQESYNQQDKEKYSEIYADTDSDTVGYLSEDEDRNRDTETDNKKGKPCDKQWDSLVLCNETTGTQQYFHTDMQSDNKTNLEKYANASRDTVKQTKTDRQQNKHTDRQVNGESCSMQGKQQQLAQRVRDQQDFALRHEDPTFGGAYFASYATMPRFIIEDGDIW